MMLWSSSCRKILINSIIFTLLICFSAFVIGAAHAADRDNVVTIYTKIGSTGSGQGTGFFIGQNGEIATAYHVVQDASSIVIFDQNNSQYTEISLIALLPEYDIAILRASDAKHAQYLRLSRIIPSDNNNVKIIGSPRGLPDQVLYGRPSSRGYISSLQLNGETGRPVFKNKIDVIPIDITVYSGMSGAPVISDNGEVAGLLSGSFTESRGIAWIIPAKYILEALQYSSEVKLSKLVNWPHFNLMDTGWHSLRRSYGLAFNAKHIAKLEIVEGIFRRIKGEWLAKEPVISSVFQYYGNDRCDQHQTVNSMFMFEDVDAETAEIVGHFRMSGSRTAKYTPGYLGYNQFTEKQCFSEITGDDRVAAVQYDLRGKFSAQRYKSNDGKVAIILNVEECYGNNCGGQAYGRKKPVLFSLATDRVLTDGQIKFEKR
jgi:serine protease Do